MNSQGLGPSRVIRGKEEELHVENFQWPQRERRAPDDVYHTPLSLPCLISFLMASVAWENERLGDDLDREANNDLAAPDAINNQL